MLEEIFHQLNQQHFASELPLPELRWNSRLSSSAGRFHPRSRIPFLSQSPLIEVATYLRELPDGDHHIRDTLLHEMVHYLLWFEGRPYGHTPEFHRILKRVGARRYNPVPKFREPKHWYQCPACRKAIPTRRKIGPSACLDCCKQQNGGRFHEKFRLVLMTTPPMRNPPGPALQKEEAPLPPHEIIRRLEALKNLVLRSRESREKTK